MTRPAVTKLIVQAVAVAFGVLGLLWIFFGFRFAVPSISESDRFLICMAPWFLILGGICVAVAWQSIRRFGPNPVKSVTALVALSVYVGLSTFVEPPEEVVQDLKTELYYLAPYLIPMLLAYLFYRVVSRMLLQLTETDSSQPAQQGDVP
jgi:hypothetical protein